MGSIPPQGLNRHMPTELEISDPNTNLKSHFTSYELSYMIDKKHSGKVDQLNVRQKQQACTECSCKLGW